MHCDISSRSAAILIAAATATLFMLAPVGAQVAGPAATPAALPAPSAAVAPRQPGCEVLAEKARFDLRSCAPRGRSPPTVRSRSSRWARRRPTAPAPPRPPPPIRAGSRTSSRGGSRARDHGVEPRGQRRRSSRHAGAPRHRGDRREARPGALASRHQFGAARQGRAAARHAAARGTGAPEGDRGRYRADRSAIRPPR